MWNDLAPAFSQRGSIGGRLARPMFQFGVYKSLALGPLIQALLSEDSREVIDMDAVAHTGSCLLDWHRNTAVAVVIAWSGIMQDAE